MWRGLPALFASSLLVFAACTGNVSGGGGGLCSIPGTGPDGVDPALITSCDDVYAELENEMQSIQCCTSDSQCGQVLMGFGCGCTHNPVARLDADPTRYDALMDRHGDLCEGIGGPCDCPAADGFACKDGFCTWNYQ
jgi:hypothetical protein